MGLDCKRKGNVKHIEERKCLRNQSKESIMVRKQETEIDEWRLVRREYTIGDLMLVPQVNDLVTKIIHFQIILSLTFGNFINSGFSFTISSLAALWSPTLFILLVHHSFSVVLSLFNLLSAPHSLNNEHNECNEWIVNGQENSERLEWDWEKMKCPLTKCCA